MVSLSGISKILTFQKSVLTALGTCLYLASFPELFIFDKTGHNLGMCPKAITIAFTVFEQESQWPFQYH